MNKLAAVLALGTAGAESFVQGGTLSLKWKDCGDASTKGKVTGLAPTSLTLGTKTRVTGAGSVTEDVSAGKIAISMKASIISKTYSGDVCKAQTFTLPLGVGSITYDGVKCPLAAGAVSVPVDILLSSALPSSLAKADITISATSTSGDKLLCMAITTAPAAATQRTASAQDLFTHPPQEVPQGWAPSNDIADTTGSVEVLVGLKRANVDKLAKIFEESSTPGHENFLKHLSWSEIGDVVRPSDKAIGAVVHALATRSATNIQVAAHGDYVKASVPMHKLEELTSGSFQSFQHTDGRKVVRLTGGVRLPAALAEYVDTFSGLHGFPLDAAPASVEVASGDVTPTVISKTYGIGSVKKSGKQNIQAIGQFQGQYVSPSDLSKFCKSYDTGADCKIERFIGKNTGTRPGVESMLDTEYIEGLGQGVDTWVYSYPGYDFCGDLLTWAGDVAAESTHPYVVSLSYGSQKIGFCDSSTVKRLSEDVMKLGTMGVTTVIASGDDGSGGMSRQGSNNGKLSPSFPASIPYALAVGSTFFESGLSGEEQATTQFGSGGGFSYDYTIPSYQADAVKTYLAQSPQIGSKSYAPNGRATPDVALLGEKFAVEDGGRVMAVGGTSASTPSWGAVISLLNEECLTASGGQKTLGFVNPLLYKSAHAFNDITKGSNAIGENAGNGWSATKGWDAATGLGTPDFPKLQAAVKSACGSAASVVV